ncbi:hypothetical protein L6452_10144 [Arctium lappa]|uniref:Uncharacterized protein n=1 Tax=Arctium lappa TaxID=4217 RepID=A0ACB9DME5_ARCLA|nr:hypothetical protein L6452_10144 [Arctium lappa]
MVVFNRPSFADSCLFLELDSWFDHVIEFRKATLKHHHGYGHLKDLFYLLINFILKGTFMFTRWGKIR